MHCRGVAIAAQFFNVVQQNAQRVCPYIQIWHCFGKVHGSTDQSEGLHPWTPVSLTTSASSKESATSFGGA